jgi:hypothetical protein
MFGFGSRSIEPIEMLIVLGIRHSFERTMLVAERFIQDWLQNMANILCVLMVDVIGIRKPVIFKSGPSSAFLF